jgi:2,4-dienoyl-CoA reductase-like NADH-dependent reductase (Old Yellow Enzyme family)
LDNKYNPIFEPFTFPSGVTINNRILLAPMTTSSSDENGEVTEAELQYYEKRSGQIGAVITACAYVKKNGKAFAGGFGADSDDMIPSLTKVAERIQQKGSKAILQIFHGGRMTPVYLLEDGTPIAPSSIPAARPNAPTPREMTLEEIDEMIQNFADATRRAIEAGFDGVEIHGANTYLIQQFFSPHSNQRDDQWGGTLEKRMNFPLTLIRKMKETVTKFAKKPFLIGYRISPEELENPGITLDDTYLFIENLVKENLDYLHLSINGFWRSSIRDKEDTTPIVDIVVEKFGNQIPIIGVGSLRHPDDVIKALDSGVPLVSLGRELIMEPDWIQKLESGKIDEIRTTLSLNDREVLSIPTPLWDTITGVPGWFPIEEKVNK